MSTNEDLAVLTAFLDDLKLILESFLEDYIEHAIPKQSRYEQSIPIFRNSFLAAKRALVISVNRLNEPDEELLRKLDEHGLRGQSLALKIGIVNADKKPLLTDIKKRSSWSNLRDKFSRFFRAADIPLGSLSDCIPGLGLTLEFKEAIEHVISDQK